MSRAVILNLNLPSIAKSHSSILTSSLECLETMSMAAPIDLREAIEVQSRASQPSSPVPPLLLRVVLRTSRVRYDMHLVPVDPSATGQTVMESLRKLYSQDIGTYARRLEPLLRVLTMKDVAVSSAIIVPVWFSKTSLFVMTTYM